MPHTDSAKKRVRQNEQRTLRNRAVKGNMRSAIRQVREAVAGGRAAEAAAGLSLAYKRIDKAAKGHVIHANTAANQKRRLARLVASAAGR